MSRRTLSFIALAISMFYGVGFVGVPEDDRSGYAVVGGVVVALAWIASGRFGKPDQQL
jgi:Mg2+ and Co2+ transporter CorA